MLNLVYGSIENDRKIKLKSMSIDRKITTKQF